MPTATPAAKKAAAKKAVPGATTPPPPATPAQLQIQQIDVETLLVPVVGTMPLIVHNWSEKAKRQMLDAQQGRKTIKEHRDPEAEFESSLYRTKDGYGFPSVAFKAATVSAARLYGKAVRMTELRQFLFFRGEMSENCNQALFPIFGEPKMREDMVTVGISGTDLRYRAEFPEWTSQLTVQFVKSAITRDSVLSIIMAAGLTVGVGEWRPEKNGEYGTFRLDDSSDITVIS
jgi:hypothetical protein